MPGLYLKITCEPGQGMKEALEKFGEAMKNDPTLQAKFRAVAKSMKDFSLHAPALNSAVNGHLQKAHEYEKKKIDCEVMPLDDIGFLEKTPMLSPGELARLLYEIARQAADYNPQLEDTFRSGQGVVFRSLSRLCLKDRLKWDAWENHGQDRAGYYQRWFRGRTAKSMKAPCWFKRWKGRR